MKKKILRRIACLASAAVITVGACAMFAGCTSSNPQITITYEFNGTEYKVDYKLSRSDAPKTVQHFIELADAGYYDGTCIHDFENSNFLHGGGYYFDEHNELTEKDYFAEVKALEKEGNNFTQYVFATNEEKTPLYTVYGEFKANGVETEGGRENIHSKGALVMYYPDMGTSANGIEVSVARNDGGKNDVGVKEQQLPYALNSATSLFYTYLGSANLSRDNNYAVFGKTVDFAGQMQPLLDAISDYVADLEDDETTEDIDESSFTRSITKSLNSLDHKAAGFEAVSDLFDSVRKGGIEATFNTPQERPITIVSVKVTKY